jgi:outer membrane protein TolC
MKLKFWCFISLILFFQTFYAQERADVRVFTLQSSIETALIRNPLSKGADIDVQRSAQDVKKAIRQKIIPQMSFDMQAGLVPEARGDIFFSPDKSNDFDGLGPYYELELGVFFPLYTFGRMSAALEAARQQLRAQESQRDHVLENLSFDVIRAYWALSASHKAETVALELQESFGQLKSEVEERLQQEDSEVDDLDLLEVKTHQLSIEEIYQESREKKDLASKIFNALLDFDIEQSVRTSDENTPQFAVDRLLLDDLLHRADTLRPELKSLNAAIKALEAKIKYEKGDSLPAFFLAGGIAYANAGNRQDQTNPFVLDSFNYRKFGLFLGVEWDLNFWIHDTEIKKSQYHRQSTMEKWRALKAAIQVEVSQAFLEARKNAVLLETAKESLESAKTWLRVSLENWELGIQDVYRMLRAYEAYYRLRRVEIEREFAFNVALAKLAFRVGDINLYLNWVKDGKVVL